MTLTAELVSIPPAILPKVPAAAQRILAAERRVIAACHGPRLSIDQLRHIVKPLA